MFYFVKFSYSPNTAPTNRAIGIWKALSEMGVHTRVVFFAPDKHLSRFNENLPHVDFEYLWDNHYINLPKLKLLSLRLYLHQFVQRLKPGDKVYVYSFPELVVALSKRNDIEVYEERTEHNDASYVSIIRKTPIPLFLDACRRISGMFVISQGLKQYYIENGCHPDRVHILNMFVDTTRFQNLEKQPTEPYIAYCGTASNNKDGVDQLIKAFAMVVKKFPKYKLYIIGNTPSKQQRFDNLELVKNLGIENNVVFTGVVSSSNIPQMLKNATILALDRPNNLQAKYGFPTKLGEYLQTGNPVVITRVGDIPLFLKDGESALIAEPENPESFAEKLCWAIEHPDEAREIGKNGKHVADIHFNSILETKKIISVLNNK